MRHPLPPSPPAARDVLRRAAVALAATLALLVTGLVAVPAARAAGSSVAPTKPSFQVGEDVSASYTTDQPSTTNWVGMYTHGTTPAQGNNSGWKYAPGSSGTVTFTQGPNLSPGEYDLYLLANDGYTALAGPVSVTLTSPATQHRFETIVDAYRARDGRIGDPYTVKVDKFFFADDGTPTLALASGPSWLTLSAGVLSGTPTAAGDATAVVTATLGGVTKTVTLTLPVKAVDQPLGDELRFLTYNAWQGGGIPDQRKKELSLLLSNEIDVVTLQETHDVHAGTLASDLGWFVQVTKNCQSNGAWCAVVSRYPLGERAVSNASTGALVQVDEAFDRTVWVYSSHLDYRYYAPYIARDGGTLADVLAEENRSNRTAEIHSAITKLDETAPADGDVPAVFAGDMNTPSHLDWNEAAKANHFGLIVPWPVSTALQQAGFTDTYRAVHPDPVTDPANSWSPRDTDEVQDRLDFIYERGAALKAVDSVYLDGGDLTNWTSDHGAFVTTFAWEEAADSAALQSLTVGGQPVAGFDAATSAYTVQLPAGTRTAPAVAAVAAVPGSHVTVAQAGAAPGTTEVTVTSRRGTQQRVYRVAFTVATTPVTPVDPAPTTPVAPTPKPRPTKVKPKIGKVVIVKGKHDARTIERGGKAVVRVKVKKIAGLAPKGKVLLKVGKKIVGKAKIKRVGKKYVVVIKTKKLTKKGKVQLVFKKNATFSKAVFTTKVRVR